jgi:predicted metal-dependent phosphoesterase TrpH
MNDTPRFCDLHMHSTASDGTDAPEALASIAQAQGLAAIALTDHDTTEGVPACARACAALNIDFVPGIELSTDPRVVRHEPLPDGRLGTLHILGLFVRHDDAQLIAIHEQMLATRLERNPQIIENLNKLGVRVTYDEVIELAGEKDTQVIGRPHIAQLLVRKGYVKTISDAFARYIGEGKPGYARKNLLLPGDAIQAIHHAGGLAVLAHPYQLRCPDDEALAHAVAQLKRLDLDAMETRHRDHSPAQQAQYALLAAQFNLLTTGGSDYHGKRKAQPMGCENVPYSVYETLRDFAQARAAAS